MYCVICGIFLRDDRQAGLVCRECGRQRRAQEKRFRRGNGGLPIRVYYCFRCGRPYQPDDRSICHTYHLYGFFASGEDENEQKGRKQHGEGEQERSSAVARAD